jgi:hypothetical protein
MAGSSYVPGFSHDLFVSYASEDKAWVEEFQTKLTQALIERGLEADLWRDREDIRFGQNWKTEMFKAVENAALFLAILSPNYRRSDYCNDESDYFQEIREKTRDMKVGDKELYRYLKVIKMAWDNDAHLGLLPELQHIEFFNRDPQTGIDFPLAFSSPEFEMRIRLAAHGVASTLKAMRRLREMVYVASPADDVDAAWKELRAELCHQGYVVGPEAKLNRGLASEFIKNEIKGAVLTIHLLGAEYHPLVERQLDLCAEMDQKMAIWIQKDAEQNADEQQRKLLKAVRDFEKIPKGTPVLEGVTGRTAMHDLLELLKPKPLTQGRTDGDGTGPMIYLICDPSVDEDRAFALGLEQQIEKNEKMQVMLPQKDVQSAHEKHQQMLRDCDGVLLYRDKAPEPWFFQYFADVARAEKLLKRPTITSKAVLAGADELTDFPAPASVRLLNRANPFDFGILEPFLAPLRTLPMGVANAAG